MAEPDNFISNEKEQKKNKRRQYILMLFILIIFYLAFDFLFVSSPRTSLRNFMNQPVTFDVHYSDPLVNHIYTI